MCGDLVLDLILEPSSVRQLITMVLLPLIIRGHWDDEFSEGLLDLDGLFLGLWWDEISVEDHHHVLSELGREDDSLSQRSLAECTGDSLDDFSGDSHIRMKVHPISRTELEKWASLRQSIEVLLVEQLGIIELTWFRREDWTEISKPGEDIVVDLGVLHGMLGIVIDEPMFEAPEVDERREDEQLRDKQSLIGGDEP